MFDAICTYAAASVIAKCSINIITKLQSTTTTTDTYMRKVVEGGIIKIKIK